ncbi:MAG TPA: tetratricopeptide repeat protein [Polyangiaceae bacterium]|nr:tetratricopeptide repeat protein [Polyangiaceae bacterium]
MNMQLRGSVLLLAVLAAACGSGGGSGAAAKAPPSAPPTMVGQSGAGVPDEEFGVSDTPGAEGAAERPKMTASAAEAYAAGVAAFRSGDMPGARTQFSQATQRDSKAFQAYYSLGVVRERLGDVPGALSSYRQSTMIVPDYEPAIVGYSVLLARSGKADEAVEYLNGRLGALPNSAAVAAAMAEVKSIQGDSGAAQRYAQEALKKNPDYRPAMVTIARDHYRARRLDLALYALKGVLDGYGPENPPRDKNNSEARLIRGLIYKEQGLRGPSMEELKRAVEIRPDLVEARVHLATYFLEAGNAADAAPLLEGAVRYQPDHVIARLNLGDAYRLLGKAGEAKRELEWVAQKDPSLYQVHYDLGLLYLFADSVPGVSPAQAVDRAIEELERYRKMRPRVAGTNDDTEELITRAKTKKGLLEAKNAESEPVDAAPTGGGATGTTQPAKPTAGAGTAAAPASKPAAGGAQPAAGTGKPAAGGSQPAGAPAAGAKQ